MIMNQRSWKLTGFVATVVIVLSFPVSLILNRHAGELNEPAAVLPAEKPASNVIRKNTACGKDRITTAPWRLLPTHQCGVILITLNLL